MNTFPIVVVAIFLLLPNGAGASDCQGPEPVCAARAAIFKISAFDPEASATRIGRETLVTTRHSVADEVQVRVFIGKDDVLNGSVIPSAYPGDIVLIKVPGLPPGPVLKTLNAPLDGQLRTIGYDVGRRSIKVYAAGETVFSPAAKYPLARLHSTAYSQPGNSGGALVDGSGRLLGIIASGSKNRSEAIPAQAIAELQAQSGPDHVGRNNEIGRALRQCTLDLEVLNRNQRQRISAQKAQLLETICLESRNRQLFDLAAQTLGRRGFAEASIALFEASLAEDPNAVNSRIGLSVSLSLARRHDVALEHLKWLMANGVEDLQVLRLAIQAGVWGDDMALAN